MEEWIKEMLSILLGGLAGAVVSALIIMFYSDVLNRRQISLQLIREYSEKGDILSEVYGILKEPYRFEYLPFLKKLIEAEQNPNVFDSDKELEEYRKNYKSKYSNYLAVLKLGNYFDIIASLYIGRKRLLFFTVSDLDKTMIENSGLIASIKNFANHLNSSDYNPDMEGSLNWRTVWHFIDIISK